MKIQEACSKTKLTKRTIHFYIKEELIHPAVNKTNGYYNFNETDIMQLNFIKQMRNADISLAAIRSLIHSPSTATYYLHQQIKKNKSQKEFLETTIDKLEALLESLPINPKFSDLYTHALQSDFQPPLMNDSESDNNYEMYNIEMINRFLWGMFLPESTFSEYQQFLWDKLNRITSKPEYTDYHKIYHFLQSLDHKEADQLFSQRSTHIEYIASLTEHDYSSYVEKLKHDLEHFICTKRLVSCWLKYYDAYFSISTRIFDSELNKYMLEMSPTFEAYHQNIHIVCEHLYQWLHSDGGRSLLNQLESQLGPCMDLDCCHHGQIEAMACIE